MAKHTGGEWYVGAQNDALYVIDQPPRPSTDDVNPGLDVTVIAKVYEGRDAARLIASAPCLLAACEAMLAAWHDKNALDARLAALGMAKAAVAKARGG